MMPIRSREWQALYEHTSQHGRGRGVAAGHTTSREEALTACKRQGKGRSWQVSGNDAAINVEEW